MAISSTEVMFTTVVFLLAIKCVWTMDDPAIRKKDCPRENIYWYGKSAGKVFLTDTWEDCSSACGSDKYCYKWNWYPATYTYNPAHRRKCVFKYNSATAKTWTGTVAGMRNCHIEDCKWMKGKFYEEYTSDLSVGLDQWIDGKRIYEMPWNDMGKYMTHKECQKRCQKKSITNPKINGAFIFNRDKYWVRTRNGEEKGWRGKGWECHCVLEMSGIKDRSDVDLCYLNSALTMSPQLKESKFNSGTNLTGNTGADKYQGNVNIMGRPVCDNLWDSKDAQVTCSVLGFSKTMTKAIPWKGSRFGPVIRAFQMSKVQCNGWETSLATCNSTSSYNRCESKKGAGVTCIDASTLKLESDSKLTGEGAVTQGRVMLNEMPVCNDGWTHNDAQVVCNQLLGSKFTSRRSRNVLVKSTTSQPWTGATSIRNVQCTGNETHLAQCELNAERNCPSQQQVVVECARCTPDDLMNILKSIKRGILVKDTVKSVQAGLRRLKSQCVQWDCSSAKKMKPYKEYCEVKTSLEQSLLYLEQADVQVVTLQTEFEYGKLLNHDFMQKSITSQINKVGDKIDDFQTKLGKYFRTIADYEYKLAMKDLEEARGLYANHENQIRKMTEQVNDDMKNVFSFANQGSGWKILTYLHKAGRAFALSRIPIFGVSERDYEKTLDEITLSMAASEKLEKGVKTLMPKVEAIGEKIKTKKKETEVTTLAMENILRRKGPLTEKDVNDIITGYGNFKEIVTSGDLAVLESILHLLASTACDAINAQTSTTWRNARALWRKAMGACLEIEPNIALLISSHKSSQNVHKDIKQALGRTARAQLAYQKATSLIQTLKTDLDEKIKRQVAKLDSVFLMQVHKEKLIRDACNYITYHNHGKEKEECKKLMANPNLSTERLISYNYAQDMCECPSCTQYDRILPIPAKLNKNGAKLSPGTIDLSQLYGHSESNKHKFTKGSTTFEIPSRQWLVDNGWLSSDVDDRSPIFVKSIQLFVPPDSENRFSYDVHTTLKHSGYSELNEKQYEFPQTEMKTEYRENAVTCANRIDSFYNLDNCRAKFKPVCVAGSPGNRGPLYASLIGSKWSLNLFSSTLLTKPFPIETFYFKAKVKYCTASTRNDPIARHFKRQSYSSLTCCSRRKMVFDQLLDLKNDDIACRKCPSPSVPRMGGYYCESCPPGYQPSRGVFGCHPCGIAYIKAAAGNARCERCPTNQTTIAVGQTHCISGEGLPSPPPITIEPEPETETVLEVPSSSIESLVTLLKESAMKISESATKIKQVMNKVVEKVEEIFPSLA